MLENIEFESPEWIPIAIAIAAIGGLCVLWSFVRSPIRGPSIWLATLLKLTAVASLALYLVEPYIKTTRPKPGANALAVVVDNSRSMSIRAGGQATSFEDKLKRVLQRDANWHARASQDFAVRLYSFDTRLRALESFDELKFDGNSSALGAAIETVIERYEKRPAAGVLLFTDGMSTDAITKSVSGDKPLPIYPIVDLERDVPRDISIVDPMVTESAFELAPVQIEATVHCQGFKDEKVLVRLFNEKGASVADQELTIDADAYQKRVRFQYRPLEPGIQFVRLRALAKYEDDAEKVDVQSNVEVTTTNNNRLLAVDRGGGPYRILYVAGRPNWDFKFFRRAVEEDQELRLAALIRIARKEAKFNFRDRTVDSTNPLFAGFEDDQDAAEQYDEPILLAIGTRSEDELKVFPKTEEDLFAFDAIVIDDIEAKFFTQEQMLLIRQFVSTRGGGLLMLGGSEAFDRGGYRDTPVGDLLPVYLRSGLLPSQAQAASNSSTSTTASAVPDSAEPPSVSFRLTREGSLETWMRLRSSEVDEAKRLSEMPRFYTWNEVKDVKPGASILAVLGAEDNKSMPGMIAQSFGSGRVGALTVGDMWRWAMRRSSEENNDLAQSWRQVARWLTSDVPRPLELEIVPPKRATDPHVVRIKVRNEKFQPLDNALLDVSVLPPDGKLISVEATPDREQPGLYLANFWSQTDGAYVVSVKASAPDGSTVGEAESGWAAEPSALEFRTLTPNIEELNRLASASGGEVIDIDDLDRFVGSLPTRQVPITEVRRDPFWHRTQWLLLTIVCLCAEWGLRRLRGLP